MRQEIIKQLKVLIQDTLSNVEIIVTLAEKYNLTNEQFFIDWEDKLNEYSIKDHGSMGELGDPRDLKFLSQ